MKRYTGDPVIGALFIVGVVAMLFGPLAWFLSFCSPSRTPKPAPAPLAIGKQLYVAQKCCKLDIRLSQEALQKILDSGEPLKATVPTDDRPIPDTICLDDALVRISIEGREIITITAADDK